MGSSLKGSRVLRAPTFKFLVGSDGTCFNVPTILAKDISPPLDTLMNGGQMKESHDRVAVLKEVECETFTAFCEYAYTGTYRVPKVTVEFVHTTPKLAPDLDTLSYPQASEVVEALLIEPEAEVGLESALETNL